MRERGRERECGCVGERERERESMRELALKIEFIFLHILCVCFRCKEDSLHLSSHFTNDSKQDNKNIQPKKSHKKHLPLCKNVQLRKHRQKRKVTYRLKKIETNGLFYLKEISHGIENHYHHSNINNVM